MKSFRSVIPVVTLLFAGMAFISKTGIPAKKPAHSPQKSIALCGGSTCKVPSRAVALRTSLISAVSREQSTADMVLIKGTSFQMGSTEFSDAKPIHAVTVTSFWMDTHEVTNAQFEAFVNATGYRTVAERPLNPADYPGVPADKLVPGSAVFTPPSQPVSRQNPLQWWQYVAGANWRHPQGPQSNLVGKGNEPVVQVCYEDAAAYAKWAGKRLPTEAEWEFAARSGRKNTTYYWGNNLKPNGKWVANIFQGSFPTNNTLDDGFRTAAPVKTFPANPNGLYDMDGNVWEWCSDLYRPDYYQKSPIANPKGPNDSFDPDEPGTVKHVQRGGSFLCSDQYCIRYKAGSRGKGETSSASNNLGFRCVRTANKF
ncbi:formylglycine-generating enzyme family protein [Spirosoma telluris]